VISARFSAIRACSPSRNRVRRPDFGRLSELPAAGALSVIPGVPLDEERLVLEAWVPAALTNLLASRTTEGEYR
jgi:hypothetical protein